MPHMLARLKGVKPEIIKQVLQNDAPAHAKEGFYLEYFWINDDDPDEILFLFRVKDLDLTKKFINKVHGQALKEDPLANLPGMTFLKE